MRIKNGDLYIVGCSPSAGKSVVALKPRRRASIKWVRIPACSEHAGIYAVEVLLNWTCPVCGGPRGEVYDTLSYDGSRRLGVNGWCNPCGHIDYYVRVRNEAATNGLNT